MTLARFTGRVVVINGATGTIGSALATALQREGAQLVLFGRKAAVLDGFCRHPAEPGRAYRT